MRVLQFETPRSTPKPKPISHKAKSKRQYQLMSASAIGACACVVTSLSLNHLATGIAGITGSSPWQSWAMAIGVDCAFVSLELAQLTISDKLRTKLAPLFRPAIIGTLTWSAILNAMAFAGEASNPTIQGLSIALGLSIPALIYLLTKIGAAIYLDSTH